MLMVTSILAWKFLLPAETENFAQSLIAAVLSGSNFLFWSQAGYFDSPSALKPLLHTWSLGVEEQFYVFFPLFILLVRRWQRSWFKPAIWITAFVSFLLACVWVYRSPSAAFFWSPLRAWELLIGTIASQSYLPTLRTSFRRNLASAAGLLLIVVPAFLFNARTPFPGLAAVPGCVGTALLIAAGETGSAREVWRVRYISGLQRAVCVPCTSGCEFRPFRPGRLSPPCCARSSTGLRLPPPDRCTSRALRAGDAVEPSAALIRSRGRISATLSCSAVTKGLALLVAC